MAAAIYPPRRVPVDLGGRLKEELKSMECLGIITKVTKLTAWVSSFVIIRKPDSDKLKVCLGPKDLRKKHWKKFYLG